MAAQGARRRWRNRLELARLTWQASPPLTALCCLLALVAPIAQVTFMVSIARVVGLLPALVAGRAGAGQVTPVLLVATGALAAATIVQPLVAAVATLVGRAAQAELSAQTMEAALAPLGLEHLEEDNVRNAVMFGSQAQGGLPVPGADAVAGGFEVMGRWLQALAAITVLSTVYWWLGLVLLCIWIVARTRMTAAFLVAVRALGDEAGRLRRANYFRDLAGGSTAAKETRLFGLQDWSLRRFQAAWEEAMATVWDERRGIERTVLGVMPLMMGGQGFALAFAGWQTLQGHLSLAALALVLQGAYASMNLVNFSNAEVNVQYGAQRAAKLRSLVRRARVDAAPRATRSAAGLPAQEIRFEGVSFSYPNGNRVFDGLDLVIPAGRSLALVGANGAGKTTLVKLLARMYEPSAGRITVDGIDLRELDPESWRRRLAAIFQDFVRYQLDVRMNVAAGALWNRQDQDLLDAAARRTGVADLIASLPQGWDTVLSTAYKDGTDLSGGQWQKLALARAFFAIAGGAGVLVLDEPTANLDVRAEADLFDRYLDLTSGVTSLVISHRFSTVRRADQICVIERGRITQRGTHDELMAAGGLYADMFRMQSERFVDQHVDWDPVEVG